LRAARKLFQTAVAELTADDAVGISPRMERAQP